jgi:ferredoxin
MSDKFKIEISDECISCGACEQTCPVSAISQGATKFQIDQKTCVQCKACTLACPVGAIKEIKS